MLPRRLPRTLVASALASGLLACGGSGGGNPVSPSPAPRTIQGRVVDLFDGDGLPGAELAVEGVAATTGPDGRFSVEVSAPAVLLSVRVSAPGYYTRQTFVPGSGAVLALTPSAFDMSAFDDVGRESEGRTVRWVSDPVVYVDDRGIGVSVPDAELAAWIDEAERSLPGLIRGWTGSEVEAARVIVGADPPAPGTAGTLIVTFDEDPARYPGDADAAGWVRTWRGAGGGIVAADVRLRYSGLKGPAAALSRTAVLTHEVGHALGLGHMDRPVSSIMTPVIRVPSRTAFDVSAGTLLYRRPPGNASLDRDSESGYRAGLESAVVRVETWTCGASGVALDAASGASGGE